MSTEGVVESVFGPNDYGFYKIKVGGVWHGLGKKDPGLNRGDYVKFDAYLKDGKYSTVKGEVRKVQAPQGASAPAASSSPSSGKSSYQAKDDYWSNKEKYERETVQPRIMFSWATTTAVAIADVLAKNNALVLPTKTADRQTALEKYIAEKAAELVAAAAGAGAETTTDKPAEGGEKPEASADGSQEAWT